MAEALNILSRNNKFAKRHYEAVALAMQDARRLPANDQWQCVVNCLYLRRITAISSVIGSSARVSQGRM
jgi:hypothetical protein